MDFWVFEQPEKTILSGHVEGNKNGELHSHLMVEIKSADTSKVESVFPLPLANFFQVKDLPKGKHLLKLRSSLSSRIHKFESETIEVDLEKNAQVHVGPLRYSVEEVHQKQVCFIRLQAIFFWKIILLENHLFTQLLLMLFLGFYTWLLSIVISLVLRNFFLSFINSSFFPLNECRN